MYWLLRMSRCWLQELLPWKRCCTRSPMVVAYKMNSLTFWLVRKLVKVNFISLPNLLAGGKLVPEFFQSDCRADILGQGIQNWIDNPASIALYLRIY